MYNKYHTGGRESGELCISNSTRCQKYSGKVCLSVCEPVCRCVLQHDTQLSRHTQAARSGTPENPIRPTWMCKPGESGVGVSLRSLCAF